MAGGGYLISSKYLRNFSRNSKKRKLKKGRESLHKVLGKFYPKFEKILNKICEILEQTGIFVNSFMKHNIKNN